MDESISNHMNNIRDEFEILKCKWLPSHNDHHLDSLLNEKM